jgi:rhomboid protease GluP
MTRFPPLSVGLIFLLAAAFAWELSVGALDSKEALLRAGALRRVEVLKGEVWRFVTGMNMHGNTDHLVSNCVGLFVVGLAVEHAYGIGSALVMYVVAGLVGGIFCVAFEGEATVGASGAIFGWWGAAVVFFHRYRGRLSKRDAQVGTVLLVWALWTIGKGFMTTYISNASHIGGFLAGAAIAALVPTRLAELHDPPADVMRPF